MDALNAASGGSPDSSGEAMTLDVEKLSATIAAQLEGDPIGGAALCVIAGGVPVYDEVFGLADAHAGTPYSAETLQIIQSMGKGVIASAAAMLISRDQLDPNERVAAYWPEFGAAGKENITVRQLFSHQAGLVYLDATMPLELTRDRDKLADALVQQAPAWEPGTAVGYSPQTFGNYADILFEHACGTGFGGLLDEISSTLGVEMHVGLPRQLWDRAALTLAPEGGALASLPPEMLAELNKPDSILMRVLQNIPGAATDPTALVNGEQMREALIPAANMFSNARSLATLYAAMGQVLDGAPSTPWNRDVLAQCTKEVVRGTDVYMHHDTAFALGFQKPSATYPIGRNPGAFGHAGSGGSVAFADPEAGFSMCWIATRYAAGLSDPRLESILDVIYSSVYA